MDEKLLIKLEDEIRRVWRNDREYFNPNESEFEKTIREVSYYHGMQHGRKELAREILDGSGIDWIKHYKERFSKGR